MRLYLLRHGQAVGNREGRFLGHVDPPLTADGRAQAHRMGAALVGRGIACIQASDLLRAYETATTVGTYLQLPVTHTAALREVDYGVLDGLAAQEVRASPYGQAREKDKYNYAPPQGESYRDMETRLLPVVQTAPNNSLLVTHLGAIRVLLHCLCGYGEAEAVATHVGHEQIIVLETTGKQWRGTLMALQPPRE